MNAFFFSFLNTFFYIFNLKSFIQLNLQFIKTELICGTFQLGTSTVRLCSYTGLLLRWERNPFLILSITNYYKFKSGRDKIK